MSSSLRKSITVGLVLVFPLTTPGALSAIADEQPTSAAAHVRTDSGSGFETQKADREILAQHLVDLGTSPEEAKAVVSALTADDVRVLAENPEMLALAGDGNDAMATVGIVLLILLGIGLLAAALAP